MNGWHLKWQSKMLLKTLVIGHWPLACISKCIHYFNSHFKGKNPVPNLRQILICKGCWLARPIEEKQSNNTHTGRVLFLCLLANVHARQKYRWTGHPQFLPLQPSLLWHLLMWNWTPNPALCGWSSLKKWYFSNLWPGKIPSLSLTWVENLDTKNAKRLLVHSF